MHSAARTVHIRCYLIAPAQIMRCFFMCRGRSFIAVYLIQDKLGGILSALKHIKAHATRLKL